jgi:ribonuclease HI
MSNNTEHTSKSIGSNIITIYTDGGCHNTGDLKGLGAWAFVEFSYEEIAEVHCGRVDDTTNNRTEMLAVINALKYCPEGSTVNIISDSGYVVKGYNHPSYLDTWLKNGWKTSSGSDVMNQDLWQELIALSYHYGIKFTLVRGHYKDANPLHQFWNSVVDRACTCIMQSGIEVEHTTMNFNINGKRFDI